MSEKGHLRISVVLVSPVVMLSWTCSPVDFVVSGTVTGVRSQYCALFTLLGLWSDLVGFVTEYYTSSTCIPCAKSLKPSSCLQPQVSSTALLWDFMPSACGHKPSNKLSGLKHVRTPECVGQPLANVVDWTVKGVVTPVKNREQCDLCWAFSSTDSPNKPGFYHL